jgi:hypothetical protein
MTRYVVGLFRDGAGAQAALQDLELSGFVRENISQLAYDGAGEHVVATLTDIGVPGHEAKYYEEASRRGGMLLIVRIDEDGALQDRAQTILDRHGALDVEESAVVWRSEGWDPDDAHSDAPNYGEEGGSSQWSRTALTAAEERASRAYPDKRRPS